MGESRSKNSKRNIIAGLFERGVSILMPFATRTAILWILGAEYQGLSTLFTSVLSVLNLAELGLETSIVYSMYEPVAQHDEDKVRALLAFFKKAYFIIGCCISAIGLLLLPILPQLINGDVPGDINIYVLYLLYLANSVISYFCFAYKGTVLQACQRKDIIHKTQTWLRLVEYTVKFVLLIVTHNYYLFVIVSPLFTLLNNLIIALSVRRLYPEYNKPRGKLDLKTKQSLQKQVGGLMVNKIGDVARNAMANIIISSILGLVLVAVYGNYYYIFSSVYGIILVVNSALTASVGNSVASESLDKNYSDFNKLNFLFAWLSGWCTVCMLCLYQPFMELWAGKDMMLSFVEMACFCLYFYVINMNNIRNVYIDANGLWWKLKGLYLVEAVCTLLLSFVLGSYWGIIGILLATILTLFVFNFLCRSHVLFQSYFQGKHYMAFLRTHGIYFLCTLINCAVTYAAVSVVTLTGIVGLLVRGAICVAIPNLIYLVLYGKSDIFRKSQEWAKNVLKNR